MGSLHIDPKVHSLFKGNKLKLMERTLGSYNKEIVREFYASYVSNIRGSIDRRERPAKHDPHTFFLVRGCRFDISEATLCGFLNRPTTETQ